MIEFVTASHNEEILNKNLLTSNLFSFLSLHVQRHYSNISKAYNDIQTKAITCYVHHDVYLPESFLNMLISSIRTIEKHDKNWGVIGVAGVKLIEDARSIFGFIKDRGKTWGTPYELPHEVDTLDELLLVTHGDLKFDENLPTDFYGADICMQAKQQGRKCYAVNAPCHHNSTRAFGGRTESFYTCEKYFAEKWKAQLPIATTCTIVE